MPLSGVLLPFDRGDLVSLIHERGLIEEESHHEAGTYVEALVPDQILAQLMPTMPPSPLQE